VKNVNIGVRVTPRDRKLLDDVCEARGEDISSFIRRAIRKELALLSFIPAEEKKALRILENDTEGE
jgi:uncharacterized protein (DUF1778 family)